MNVVMRGVEYELTGQLARGVETLALRMRGRIITAADADYDALRAVALGNWNHRPLFIARVQDAADVADVVDFARRNHLEVAIRSGGHSVCGHSSSAGGVVIDLRDLRSIAVDTEAMTAWVGSGLNAGEVSAELDQHRVVVGFGDSASVGIGGLTLGGGLGYMARKHGLTIDALLAAEIVTAPGDILTIDQENHPDLFWAIRGGGGNFGVVTRFKYRLSPLPEFTGGPLVLPATAEVVTRFVAAAKAAPEELTTILVAMPCPPLPFLPPEVHGRTVLFGMMAYAGPEEGAAEALAPFRALATPIADLIRPGPYSMMYLPEEPGPAPSVSVRAQFVEDIDLGQAEDMLNRIGTCTAPMRMGQIRILGGAAARVPAEATAYAHRAASILFAYLAVDGAPEAARIHDRWAEEGIAALCVGAGTYVNFQAEEGGESLAAAYPDATLGRLREIKRRYDPTNLFRLNQNIPSAA